MTKEEVKAEVTKTLRQVDVAELPAMKQAIKVKAFMCLMFSRLDKDTADAVLEACDEFGEEVTE